MTSVDSGVETGNDSNDSYATVESQSTPEVTSPAKLTNLVLTFHKIGALHFDMNKSPTEHNNEKEGDTSETSQFRVPCEKYVPEELLGSASSIDPPAGLNFCNLQQNIRLGNGYEVIGEFRPVSQHEMQRKIRVFQCRLKNHRSTWSQFKGPLDERRLRQAASTNNVDMVAATLDAGVNPSCCDDQGRSPLHLAACRGYAEVVRLLLVKGADPNRRDSLGNTPLHLAACTNNVTVVTLLLNAGTDVQSIDYYGRSPLQLAQSKLKLLHRGLTNEDSRKVKEEVCQVIEMMLAYLHKRGQESEAELLGAFSSRLTLSNTREEVETGVRDLLASLADLSIDQAASKG